MDSTYFCISYDSLESPPVTVIASKTAKGVTRDLSREVKTWEEAEDLLDEFLEG